MAKDYIARNHYPYSVRRYTVEPPKSITTEELNLHEAMKLVSIELTNTNPVWDRIYVSQTGPTHLEHYVFTYVREA